MTESEKIYEFLVELRKRALSEKDTREKYVFKKEYSEKLTKMLGNHVAVTQYDVSDITIITAFTHPDLNSILAKNMVIQKERWTVALENLKFTAYGWTSPSEEEKEILNKIGPIFIETLGNSKEYRLALLTGALKIIKQ